MARRPPGGPFDPFEQSPFSGLQEFRIPRPSRRVWIGLAFVAGGILLLFVAAPLVGFLTDVCVHYTGVDAHQHDYRVRVVRECVAGSSLAAHEASLNALVYLQTGAVVSLPLMLEAMAQLSKETQQTT